MSTSTSTATPITIRLIVDERERDVYDHITSLMLESSRGVQPKPSYFTLSKRVLPLGDFVIEYTNGSLSGSIIVERKSLSDLLASIRDGRYEEQSYRLTYASGLPTLHNVLYIIEGVLTQLKSASEKALVHSTMTSLNHFKGFSVIRTSSPRETAEYLLTAVGKIYRNLSERKYPWYWSVPTTPPNANVVVPVSETTDTEEGVPPSESDSVSFGNGGGGPPPPSYTTVVAHKIKKDNITPQNIAEIMLCQIPGISSTTAMAIVAEFPTIHALLTALVADPSCLDAIATTNNGKSRKISRSCIDKVKWCLLGANT